MGMRSWSEQEDTILAEYITAARKRGVSVLQACKELADKGLIQRTAHAIEAHYYIQAKAQNTPPAPDAQVTRSDWVRVHTDLEELVESLLTHNEELQKQISALQQENRKLQDLIDGMIDYKNKYHTAKVQIEQFGVVSKLPLPKLPSEEVS